MKKIVVLLILVITCAAKQSYAQNKHSIDSLQTLLKTAKEDTNKVNIINKISDEYETMGEFVKEFQYGNEGLAIAQKLKYKKGEAKCYINIGNLYWYQSNFNKALENYLKSLKINEEIGDKKGIAYGYLCIGDIYMSQGNYEKALENNLISVKTNEEIGYNKGIAESYNDRAAIYLAQGNYDKALENELVAQKIAKENGYILIVAASHNIIGNIFVAKNNYSKALENYFDALKLFEDLGAKNYIAGTYLFIGNLLVKQNKIKESREYFGKALKLSKEIGSKEIMQSIYGIYSDLDVAQNNYKSAYTNYKLFIDYRDSISNIENTKKTMQNQMQYDFDKKQVADSIKSQAEKEKIQTVAAAESKKQKLIILFVGLGLLIVLVFAGFVFRSLRVRNKQNKIITEQKDLVEEKQREILDSIEYALRIQTAILPPTRIVKQYLENSFILYKPKDIVAGDFYWMETVQLDDVLISQYADEGSTRAKQSANQHINNQLILFAACDCTGHGVPGAMVSVVCHNALNRAVREFGLTQPAAILDKTAEIVIENFSKSEEDIKDGMDISLCSYNTQTKELQWAGANNPLWIVRGTPPPSFKEGAGGWSLEETKADKQPIGMNEGSKPFTNHTFTLNTGDTIYLFTDGFADQFGGETGEKKLTRKRFKELLLSIQNKSLQEQCIALDNFIVDYRKQVEQIDDILVMGVRI